MQYSIYKDCTVNETIKRIQIILKTLKLNYKEEIYEQSIKSEFMPYSTHIWMFGNKELGTNGKGTTLKNAQASGYAEFIERLENQAFFKLTNKNFYYSPDEKICSVNNLSDLKKYFISEKFLCDCNKMHKYIFDNNITNLLDFNKETILVPFYDVFKNNVINLPIFIIQYLQCTNGMSAGNTPEEALVQGLSEICERYSMKQVIEKEIIMPDIPKEVY